MSSKSQVQNPERDDDKSSIATDSSHKYTPQFSATTQMILERIHSRNSSSLTSMSIPGTVVPPPGYEDMRRSVLQTMRTSMNMQIPATPAIDKKTKLKYTRSTSGSGLSISPTGVSTSSVGKGKTATRNQRSKSGGKRKRIKDKSEDSDEESNNNILQLSGDSDLDDSDTVTKLPKITQSGRHIVKPTQFVPATYENYSRRRTPSRKAQEQALCKRCGRGHSPQNNMIVFCDGCNLPWHQNCHKPVIPDDAVLVESALWFCSECSQRKGIKSEYEAPPKGMSWARRSLEEATYLHPDIPLFPWPETSKTQSQPPPPPQKTYSFYPYTPPVVGSFSRPEGNPSAPINSIRKKQSLPPPHAIIPTMPASSTSSIVFTQERPVSRESTPASPPYPKPGNGLMAKLGPDNEDIDWLVDTDDYNAFSHSVVENIGSHNLNASGLPNTETGNGNISHQNGNTTGVSVGE